MGMNPSEPTPRDQLREFATQRHYAIKAASEHTDIFLQPGPITNNVSAFTLTVHWDETEHQATSSRGVVITPRGQHGYRTTQPTQERLRGYLETNARARTTILPNQPRPEHHEPSHVDLARVRQLLHEIGIDTLSRPLTPKETAVNQSHAAECTVTVFGRPLKDMEARNANYMRGAIDPEKLDFCHDCMEWRKRSAAR